MHAYVKLPLLHMFMFKDTQFYTVSRLQRVKKDAKETARYKWVLIVTELFNTAVNGFDAKKSARCSRLLVVTEFVVNWTQLYY